MTPNRQTVASDADRRLVDRFLDGELAGTELERCRQRLEREPGLRAALQERQQLRAAFVHGRDASFRPPAAFAASVLAAARRLPTAHELQQHEAAAASPVVAVCRRILIAAAIVLAATLLWHSKLFQGEGDGTLQAAPDERLRTIEQLDAEIEARAAERRPR